VVAADGCAEDEFGEFEAQRGRHRVRGSSTRPRWHGDDAARPVSRRVRGPLPGAAGDEEGVDDLDGAQAFQYRACAASALTGSWASGLGERADVDDDSIGVWRPADAAAARSSCTSRRTKSSSMTNAPASRAMRRTSGGARGEDGAVGFWNSGWQTKTRAPVARNASASSAVSRRPRPPHGDRAPGPPPWQSPTCLIGGGFDEDRCAGGASARNAVVSAVCRRADQHLGRGDAPPMLRANTAQLRRPSVAAAPSIGAAPGRDRAPPSPSAAGTGADSRRELDHARPAGRPAWPHGGGSTVRGTKSARPVRAEPTSCQEVPPRRRSRDGAWPERAGAGPVDHQPLRGQLRQGRARTAPAHPEPLDERPARRSCPPSEYGEFLSQGDFRHFTDTLRYA